MSSMENFTWVLIYITQIVYDCDFCDITFGKVVDEIDQACCSQYVNATRRCMHTVEFLVSNRYNSTCLQKP